jgi:hypothetical protein
MIKLIVALSNFPNATTRYSWCSSSIVGHKWCGLLFCARLQVFSLSLGRYNEEKSGKDIFIKI